MRTRSWIGLCAGTYLFCGTGLHAEEPDARVVRGEALYHQHCGACHGVSADGKGAVATFLNPKPPDLTRIAARRSGVFPDVEIQRIIDGRDPRAAHGPRDMPVWGYRFREGQESAVAGDATARGTIQLLVAFLKSLQVVEPAD